MIQSTATAFVIADSISQHGKRITTLALRYWRPIHPEFMTHRQFGRNAGSSRARPVKAIRQQVWSAPWGPGHWGLNQPGMQAHEEATGWRRALGRFVWRGLAKAAVVGSYALEKMGFHKQLVNRVLEPFTYIDVVVTSTEWANWEALRIHRDAQPEIRQLAEAMHVAMSNSRPVSLARHQWHLPYADDPRTQKQARAWLMNNPCELTIDDVLLRVSVARCARVSYKLFDGTTSNVAADMKLYYRLVGSQPLHASPLEHQARPDRCFRMCAADGKVTTMWDNGHLHGNLVGWIQYRKTVANEYVPG